MSDNSPTTGATRATRAAPPPVLLGSQLVFNVGFYAVVPFLALVLRDDLGLAGAAVGLVLGLRTFAQQGMFLLGGLLVERWGARTLILTGCVVRVVGFALLAAAPGLALFVVGVVLTGLGGALFSPALESLVARAQRVREAEETPRDGRTRPTLFAFLSVTGETGAVLGPVLGALLLGWGFGAVAAGGAALFALTTVALAWMLPRDAAPHRRRTSPTTQSAESVLTTALATVLRDRRFVGFAALHAVNLLAFNQLYLGLPTEVDRVGAGATTLALLFSGASALTVTAQLPVSRSTRRWGAARSLRAGYLLLSAGFLVLAGTAALPPPAVAWLPAAVAVALITLGHLVLTPVGLEQTARAAGSGPLAAYFGLLATAGGIAVLVGNTALGSLYAAATTPGPAATVPWIVLALLPLLPALLVPRLLANPPDRPHPPLQENR